MFDYRGVRKRFEDEQLPGGLPEAASLARRGGGGPRHKRGFVKMAVLELLAEQPRHGYEIIKELEQRYAGLYRPSPGSVYPVLQFLEQEGRLTAEEQDGKKVYSLTASGRQFLADKQRSLNPERERLPVPPQAPGRPPEAEGRAHDPEIRQRATALMESIRYVNHYGTPAQVRELKKIIEACSRQIHALLAQESPAE